MYLSLSQVFGVSIETVLMFGEVYESSLRRAVQICGMLRWPYFKRLINNTFRELIGVQRIYIAYANKIE